MALILSDMTKPPLWRNFPTQAALRATVRARVDEQPFDMPFADDLIADLIAERHYFCSVRGLRPVRFKKTRENQPYRFYGLFTHGWHPVSWAKCVPAPPSKPDLIVRALRDRIEPIKLAFRRTHPWCAHCRRAPAVETHHAEPTFQAIVERVFSGTTEEDIATALAAWDWFNTEQFVISENHPIVRTFDRFHSVACLEALCRTCHNATKLRSAPAPL